MAFSELYQTDSIGMFKLFWFSWRVLGVNAFRHKWASRMYDAVVNIGITIWYPVHLTAGLFMLPMQDEIYKNLSITITCIVCSFKHYCLRWKLKQLHTVEELLRQLDVSVQNREENRYFNHGPKRNATLVAKMYFALYMGTNIAGILTVLLDTERGLMYPAWFPFDWSSSWILHWTALVYQLVGVTIQIMQNLTNDTIAPVVLCLMGGHVRLLSMRVSKIGYDPKRTVKDHEDDLKMCVEDHVKLLKLFNVVQDSLSLVQLMLFISSGLNICVVLVYLIFYVDSLVATLYYSVFIMAIAFELFPCYYYGSLLQQELEGLPYAIFCSNWPDQPKRYRQNMVIFAEMALRKLTMLGGGIVGIHLESFFAICKMTYSLFTVVIRIK